MGWGGLSPGAEVFSLENLPVSSLPALQRGLSLFIEFQKTPKPVFHQVLPTPSAEWTFALLFTQDLGGGCMMGSGRWIFSQALSSLSLFVT